MSTLSIDLEHLELGPQTIVIDRVPVVKRIAGRLAEKAVRPRRPGPRPIHIRPVEP